MRSPTCVHSVISFDSLIRIFNSVSFLPFCSFVEKNPSVIKQNSQAQEGEEMSPLKDQGLLDDTECFEHISPSYLTFMLVSTGFVVLLPAVL